MELIELKKELEEVNKQISEFKTSLKIEEKEQRVAEIENMMLDADFWNDSETASTLVTESKSIKKELDEFSAMLDYLNHSEEMIEFLNDEDDEEIYQELIETVRDLKQQVEDFSFRLLFAEEYDNNTAILEIHAGAGGTDATDWAEIMLRMYERFFSKQGLTYSYLNYQSGDITGVKSATLKIEGDFAYGLLKGEKGVHRVVRISPFDPSGKRHTSFASIDVIPEFSDEEANIEINIEDLKIEGDFAYGLLKGEKGVHRVVRISPFDPSGKRHTSFASIDVIPEFSDEEANIEINIEDLKIDTYRAQGAGGQHINTTDSAVRITHLPTGIVVQSQAERSQIKNRDFAMKNLKSKLHQLELEEKERELASIRGEQKDIGWGSQIRSYVFTPYTMVKDHRTNYEVSTVDKVMDGEIIDFIDAYLHYNIKQKEIL